MFHPISHNAKRIDETTGFVFAALQGKGTQDCIGNQLPVWKYEDSETQGG